ncbi:MAG: DUF4012 domain-containing protein [Candidatus Promineifilaceae bacterium]
MRIRQVLGWFVSILFILGLLFVVYRGFQIYTIGDRLYTQVRTLSQLQMNELVSPDDLNGSVASLREEFHTFKTDWDALQDAVWPFDALATRFIWIPEYGDDLEVGLQLVEVADALFETAELLDTALDPVLVNIPDSPSQAFLLQAARQIQLSAETISSTQVEIERAQTAYSAIDITNKQIHPLLASAHRRLEPLLPWVPISVSALEAAPDLIGLDEPHHVLMLVQNADEIRATGGFITSVAYAVIHNGAISELTFLVSNDPSIDNVDKKESYRRPPEPLVEYMRLPVWLFRDANWFPDFPVTAQKAMDLYVLGRETPVDSVLAVNQFTIRDILKITGAIELNDGTQVNSSNFINVAHESWELGWNRERERKGIVSDLGRKMIESFAEISSPDEVMWAVNILLEIGQQKNLYFYSDDEAVQAFAEQVQIDGSVSTSQGDYLHIVDTNMSYDKTGLNISKGFNYHASLQDITQPYGVLTLNYANRAEATGEVCPSMSVERSRDYEARAINCFGNYLRVYVPDNSSPLSLPYLPIPDEYVWVENQRPGQFAPILDEYDKEVFAGLMVLPPDYGIEGRFVYELDAEEILDQDENGVFHYALLAQKQSGIEPYPITITVDLPETAQLLSVSPSPTAVQNNVVYFEQVFDRDLQLDIRFYFPEAILE